MQGLVLNKEGKAMREKTIITAAITGSIHTPTSPTVPLFFRGNDASLKKTFTGSPSRDYEVS